MVEDFLKGFKVSSARPQRIIMAGVDPAQHARNRLVESIKQVKKILEADISGEDLNLTITKRKNGEIVTVPKRIVRWWFQTADRNWHTVIRYGTTALKFEGGDAIQCGPELADVGKLYDRIIKAVEAGKLDTHIEIAKQRAPRGSRQAAAMAGEDDEGFEEGSEGQDEAEFEPPPPPARRTTSQQVQPNFKKRARA